MSPGDVPATGERVAGAGGGAVVAMAATAETRTTSSSVDGEVAACANGARRRRPSVAVDRAVSASPGASTLPTETRRRPRKGPTDILPGQRVRG